MDQIKTGAFIAAMRKEKGYTQRQLADKLDISDKTISKWERGNGMPEVSLMLPLCEALGINVNELLTGDRLTDADYKKKAEENMMDLVKERQESKKKIGIAILVCVVTLLASITLFVVAEAIPMKEWQKVLIVVIGLIVLLGGLSAAALLEWNAGTYECRKCGERFVPTPGEYVMGPHSITTRYLKCPKCGKKSFCKRRLTH